MTQFSGMTRSRATKKKDHSTVHGPLSKHMEPLDFEHMKIKQKNTSKHFKPRFKLKTDNLKKVLFRLKAEKEDLDTKLE